MQLKTFVKVLGNLTTDKTNFVNLSTLYQDLHCNIVLSTISEEKTEREVVNDIQAAKEADIVVFVLTRQSDLKFSPDDLVFLTSDLIKTRKCFILLDWNYHGYVGLCISEFITNHLMPLGVQVVNEVDTLIDLINLTSAKTTNLPVIE
jgi:hypothetical protein